MQRSDRKRKKRDGERTRWDACGKEKRGVEREKRKKRGVGKRREKRAGSEEEERSRKCLCLQLTTQLVMCDS